MKATVVKTLMMMVTVSFISMKASAQQKVLADSTKINPSIKITAPVNKSSDYLKVTPIRNNYYNSLGAACKAELNFEKSTNVPLRVRLGSLQQTDYMEQKPNAIKPGQ
jgi:hypothetical protein